MTDFFRDTNIIFNWMPRQSYTCPYIYKNASVRLQDKINSITTAAQGYFIIILGCFSSLMS